jgi:hypothetical protein
MRDTILRGKVAGLGYLRQSAHGRYRCEFNQQPKA